MHWAIDMHYGRPLGNYTCCFELSGDRSHDHQTIKLLVEYSKRKITKYYGTTTRSRIVRLRLLLATIKLQT